MLSGALAQQSPDRVSANAAMHQGGPAGGGGVSTPPSQRNPQLARTPAHLARDNKVTRVLFGRPGQRVGTYVNARDDRWWQVYFPYTETRRDDGAVYLRDRARNAQILIDLHAKKVFYDDFRAPRYPLYDILRTSARAPNGDSRGKRTPSGVNGHNVTHILFGLNGKRLGYYQQNRKGNWRKVLPGYQEIRRDGVSITLLKKSRNVLIKLDLRHQKVMFDDSQSPPRPLYDILEVSSNPVKLRRRQTPANAVSQKVGPDAKTTHAFGLANRTTSEVDVFQNGTEGDNYVGTLPAGEAFASEARAGDVFYFAQGQQWIGSYSVTDRSRRQLVTLPSLKVYELD